MSKRKWTNMQELSPQILAMREAGMSRKMIADELGLELLSKQSVSTGTSQRHL